jgi:hypothetical protein
MVEKFFETNTLAGLLAAMTATSALHLLSRLFEFLWRMREKKDIAVAECIEKLSDAVRSSTAATEKLDGRIKALEVTLGAASKIRVDVRRLYAVVKILSGDRWETIKKAVTDDEERGE